MPVTIIDRMEQKYFVSFENYKKLMERIKDKLVKDKYFDERIYNIYFDNDQYEFMTKSLDKPLYKEKVRLRSYETADKNSNVFLEIKKKFNGHGNKRRVVINYNEAKDYIDNKVIPNTNKQIMGELDYTFKKNHLKPKISLTYDRLSYSFKDDESYRVTFDTNIRYSNKKLDLVDLDDEYSLFNNGYIMEVKTLKGYPNWFTKALNELKLYPVSYSKVGEAYKELKERNELYV